LRERETHRDRERREREERERVRERERGERERQIGIENFAIENFAKKYSEHHVGIIIGEGEKYHIPTTYIHQCTYLYIHRHNISFE
jgi:hypothetical protein